MAEEEKQLTAKRMFQLITAGNTVAIPPDPEAMSRIVNHLNVIKHREKKLMLDLGFDVEASIINVEPKYIEQDDEFGTLGPLMNLAPKLLAYHIKLIPKPANKAYPIFEIIKPEPENNNASSDSHG